MGTKIHSRSYLPGFYSMRDLNEDSSSSSWPVFYGDNTVTTNSQYCNGYMPRNSINGHPGQDKEAVKQKMLEHEAVFKNQVSELHRLYQVQRDMMEEIKRQDLHKHRASMEPASSSSLRGSQVLPSEDNRKWHMAGFSLLNSGYGRTPTSEIELAKSPMSCTKGITAQTGQFPFQNGSTSKDAETDSRPSKARKKLFDLHLPAEEYMDTEEGEKLPDNKVYNLSNYACNGNPSNGPKSSMKLLLDNRATDSGLRGSVGLADLNDPAQIDDAMGTPSVDFLGRTSQNGDTRGASQPTKPISGHSFFANKVNEAGRFAPTYAGSTWSNPSPVGQGRLPVTMPSPSHPMKCILNQFHHPSGMYSMGYNREDRLKEGPRHGLEFSDRATHDRHLGPVTHQTPSSYAFCSPSYVGNSRHQSIASWPKPTSQNVIPSETFSNSAAPMLFGSKWQVDPSIDPKQNGFYEASASGSKRQRVDLPSDGLDYLNRNRGNDPAPDRSANHIFGNFSKPAIDINLNEAVSKSSSDEVVILQDLNKTDEKVIPENHLSALPWLKRKPSHIKNINQRVPPEGTSALSYCENSRKKETAETRTVKKLLGFPIFETAAATSESVDKERKNCMIDINVPCEPDQVELAVHKEEEEKVIRVRDHIDLNCCASDFEDTLVPSCERKVVFEIDLEAPPSLEDEDDDDNVLIEWKIQGKALVPSVENKTEQMQDEVLKDAVEMLVAISSDGSICLPSSQSLDGLLLWFVDTVSSCASGKESNFKNGFLKEVDEFEAMTLQLPESRQEDHLPSPFIPEVQILDDTGSNAFATRTRRGPSRRGRQRRDFQRDILPGLMSLSRHEVTEDVQTFAGIMRATGHTWNSGLTRRNGSARGRRRAVAEPVPTPIPCPVNTTVNVEAGLEDRSLMGWGKTTRRPRRQRCPAAGNNNNPTTVVLT